MKLSTKRCNFTTAMAELIIFANSIGYEVAADYVKRCPDCKVGLKNSCHKSGLAVDIIIYIDCVPITDERVFDRLHDFWDTLGGAERINGDKGHFSFKHQGII